MELKRALGEVEELRDQLRNKDNELTDYKNAKEIEFATLQRTFEEEKNSIFTACDEVMEKKKNFISKLKTRYEETKKEKVGFQKNLQEMKKKKESAMKAIEDLKQKLTLKTSEIEQVQIQMKEKKELHAVLTASWESKEAQNEKNIAELQKQVGAVEVEKKNLEEECASLKKKLEVEEEKLKKTVEAHEKAKEAWQSQMEAIKSELESAKSKASTQGETIQRLEMELRTAAKEIKNQRERYSKLQGMKLNQMKAVKKEDVANRLLQQKRKWAADDEVEILSQRPSKRRKLQNEEAKEEPQDSMEPENNSPKPSPQKEKNPAPIKKKPMPQLERGTPKRGVKKKPAELPKEDSMEVEKEPEPSLEKMEIDHVEEMLSMGGADSAPKHSPPAKIQTQLDLSDSDDDDDMLLNSLKKKSPKNATPDPLENTEEPSEDNVEPTQDPLGATFDPLGPTLDPIHAAEDSMDAMQDPVDPTQDPVDPTQDPMGPTQDPVQKSLDLTQDRDEPKSLTMSFSIQMPEEPVGPTPDPLATQDPTQNDEEEDEDLLAKLDELDKQQVQKQEISQKQPPISQQVCQKSRLSRKKSTRKKLANTPEPDPMDLNLEDSEKQEEPERTPSPKKKPAAKAPAPMYPDIGPSLGPTLPALFDDPEPSPSPPKEDPPVPVRNGILNVCITSFGNKKIDRINQFKDIMAMGNIKYKLTGMVDKSVDLVVCACVKRSFHAPKVVCSFACRIPVVDITWLDRCSREKKLLPIKDFQYLSTEEWILKGKKIYVNDYEFSMKKKKEYNMMPYICSQVNIMTPQTKEGCDFIMSSRNKERFDDKDVRIPRISFDTILGTVLPQKLVDQKVPGYMHKCLQYRERVRNILGV